MFILICSSNPIESNWIESNAFQSTCYRLEENLSTVFDCPLPLELHRFWLPITCGSLFHSLANSLLLVPSFNTFGAPSTLSVDVCMRLVFALYICHFALSFQMFFDVCIRKRWAKQKKTATKYGKTFSSDHCSSSSRFFLIFVWRTAKRLKREKKTHTSIHLKSK